VGPFPIEPGWARGGDGRTTTWRFWPPRRCFRRRAQRSRPPLLARYPRHGGRGELECDAADPARSRPLSRPLPCEGRGAYTRTLQVSPIVLRTGRGACVLCGCNRPPSSDLVSSANLRGSLRLCVGLSFILRPPSALLRPFPAPRPLFLFLCVTRLKGSPIYHRPGRAAARASRKAFTIWRSCPSEERPSHRRALSMSRAGVSPGRSNLSLRQKGADPL